MCVCFLSAWEKHESWLKCQYVTNTLAYYSISMCVCVSAWQEQESWRKCQYVINALVYFSMISMCVSLHGKNKNHGKMSVCDHHLSHNNNFTSIIDVYISMNHSLLQTSNKALALQLFRHPV